MLRSVCERNQKLIHDGQLSVVISHTIHDEIITRGAVCLHLRNDSRYVQDRLIGQPTDVK